MKVVFCKDDFCLKILLKVVFPKDDFNQPIFQININRDMFGQKTKKIRRRSFFWKIWPTLLYVKLKPMWEY